MENEFRLTKEQREIIDGLEKDDDKDCLIQKLRHTWEKENSLEGVYSNLCPLGMGAALDAVIVRVVHSLPPKVRAFVYSRCVFTTVSEFGAECYYKRSNRPWLIILGAKADESVVAHEIAHARLGQKADSYGNEIEIAYKQETEACLLAKRWGFSGRGTEVDSRIVEGVQRKRQGLKRP